MNKQLLFKLGCAAAISFLTITYYTLQASEGESIYISKSPNISSNPSALLESAQQYDKQGRHKMAALFYSSAAEMYFEMKRYDEAVLTHRMAMEQHYMDSQFFITLYTRKAAIRRDVEVLSRKKMHTSLASKYSLAAENYFGMGQYEKAALAYVIAMEQYYMDVQFSLALSMREEAKKAFAAASSPSIAVSVLMEYADEISRKKIHTGPAPDYLLAAENYYLAAEIYSEVGHHEEAALAYTMAMEQYKVGRHPLAFSMQKEAKKASIAAGNPGFSESLRKGKDAHRFTEELWLYQDNRIEMIEKDL